jgi:hypothetical protein
MTPGETIYIATDEVKPDFFKAIENEFKVLKWSHFFDEMDESAALAYVAAREAAHSVAGGDAEATHDDVDDVHLSVLKSEWLPAPLKAIAAQGGALALAKAVGGMEGRHIAGGAVGSNEGFAGVVVRRKHVGLTEMAVCMMVRRCPPTPSARAPVLSVRTLSRSPPARLPRAHAHPPGAALHRDPGFDVHGVHSAPSRLRRRSRYAGLGPHGALHCGEQSGRREGPTQSARGALGRHLPRLLRHVERHVSAYADVFKTT